MIEIGKDCYATERRLAIAKRNRKPFFKIKIFLGMAIIKIGYRIISIMTYKTTELR